MKYSAKETFKKILKARDQFIKDNKGAELTELQYRNGGNGSMFMWKANHATPNFMADVKEADGTMGMLIIYIDHEDLVMTYVPDGESLRNGETMLFDKIPTEETSHFVEYCENNFDKKNKLEQIVTEDDFAD